LRRPLPLATAAWCFVGSTARCCGILQQGRCFGKVGGAASSWWFCACYYGVELRASRALWAGEGQWGWLCNGMGSNCCGDRELCACLAHLGPCMSEDPRLRQRACTVMPEEPVARNHGGVGGQPGGGSLDPTIYSCLRPWIR
jgi:hypothetical protein